VVRLLRWTTILAGMEKTNAGSCSDIASSAGSEANTNPARRLQLQLQQRLPIYAAQPWPDHLLLLLSEQRRSSPDCSYTQQVQQKKYNCHHTCRCRCRPNHPHRSCSGSSRSCIRQWMSGQSCIQQQQLHHTSWLQGPKYWPS